MGFGCKSPSIRDRHRRRPEARRKAALNGYAVGVGSSRSRRLAIFARNLSVWRRLLDQLVVVVVVRRGVLVEFVEIARHA